MRFRTGLVLLIGGLVGAQWAYGSAFAINELRCPGDGYGRRIHGHRDNPSAIFYNPAGIAFLPGTQLQSDLLAVVGLFRFFPSNTPVGQVVPSNGFSGLVKPHFIPVGGMYATHQLIPKSLWDSASSFPSGWRRTLRTSMMAIRLTPSIQAASRATAPRCRNTGSSRPLLSPHQKQQHCRRYRLRPYTYFSAGKHPEPADGRQGFRQGVRFHHLPWY